MKANSKQLKPLLGNHAYASFKNRYSVKKKLLYVNNSSTVVKAKDIRTGKLVAIKIIHKKNLSCRASEAARNERILME